MLKASNNNIGDRSKIEMPKIRPFCILKSANIAKIMWKIFLALFLEDTTCTNHLKNCIK